MPSQYSHISSTRCVIGQHRQKARSTLEPLRMSSGRRCAQLRAAVGLELNVGGPIRPWIAQWWSEEGGRAITLASDSHTPEGLAGNFFEAMAMGRVLRLPAGAPPRGRVDSLVMSVLTIIASVRRR